MKIGLVALSMLLAGAAILAASENAPSVRTQNFDSDPKWDNLNNRLVPDPPPTVKQDFGYSTTNHAGGDKGEVGGLIQRSSIAAWYAKVTAPRTLNDRLAASGRFSVTANQGDSGVLFGFFNHTSRGWRTPNSLVFRLDGNGNNYWVFFEYGTQHWLSGGGVTFEGKHYQTTKTKPFPADGTPHTWKLAYDPDGADGQGQITFVLDDKTYNCNLAPGHKQDGATFDRFGVFNAQTTGKTMEAYFDDLAIDGERVDFSADPNWESHNNRGEFPDRVKRPLHDFGYSATAHAGGKTGEIGGVEWRAGKPAYYGDAVGSLGLDEPLHASGKIAFTAAAVDSGAWIGFFNAESKAASAGISEEQPGEPNILGIYIEGPSRVGHYFRPGYFNREAKGALKDSGPVIRPDGAVHTWSLDYDPRGGDGSGRITVKFDDDVQTLDLKAAHRKAGETFDHFGIFNTHRSGHYVEIYLDDLKYSAK